MKIKKRNPAIALVLSILSPGLGQIYNGQLKKGVLFYVTGFLILSSLSILGLYFYGLIVFIVIFLAWLFFAAADSLITAVKLKQIELNKYNKWYVYYIIALVVNIIMLGVQPFCVQIKAYSIPVGSMEDTLLIGDYLFANKSAYGLRNPFTNKVWIPLGKPRRGDLAFFIFPQDPNKDYIKRVIGLPGDKLQVIDKKVYINDELYETPQAHYEDSRVFPAPKNSAESPRDNFGPAEVPPEAYFVMGDNRDKSYDSRFCGFVPFDNLKGKALYVYYSKDRQDSRIRWDRIGRTVN